jgi:hypothetical protein
MVAKFFRIISFILMFRVLRSQLAMLYIDLIKIVLAACHLKNYIVFIVYLLEDEQELSLGMLIRP